MTERQGRPRNIGLFLLMEVKNDPTGRGVCYNDPADGRPRGALRKRYRVQRDAFKEVVGLRTAAPLRLTEPRRNVRIKYHGWPFDGWRALQPAGNGRTGLKEVLVDAERAGPDGVLGRTAPKVALRRTA